MLPLDWMSEDLVLTNSSGAHAKKAGEFGLMSILMLQNHMTRLITHQKNKEFVSLFSNPLHGKNVGFSDFQIYHQMGPLALVTKWLGTFTELVKVRMVTSF